MEQNLFIRVKPIQFLLAVIAVALLSPAAFADHDGSRQYVIRGVAVTGINDLCGEAVWSLPTPDPIPSTIHSTNLGEFDPDGDQPITLSPNNCNDDVVVATHTDQAFLAGAGRNDVDPRLKNIPLREVYVITDNDGTRSPVPAFGAVPGNALPPTKSSPNDTITLGDWLNARGWMHLRCEADGTAKLNMRFRNLVPNGLYTVWGVWNTIPPETTRATIVPVPLGGIPNVVIPDERGSATFFRELASCPKDITEDGSQMMFMTLLYHSDSNVSGARPESGEEPINFKTADGTEFSSILAPGAVTHDHITFLISGERL